MAKVYSEEEFRAWYDKLPAKRTGAATLLFNKQGEVLLVKPNYRTGWQFPGGVVELGESPLLAATRETIEEIGLDLTGRLRLLVVSHNSQRDGYEDFLSFIFGLDGPLSQAEIDKIVLEDKELEDFCFVHPDDADELAGEYRRNVIKNYLTASAKTGLYFENGAPVSTVK